MIWNRLIGKLPPGSRPVHLLWSLLFLKRYDTEHVNRSLTQADEKTWRKWVWIFVELLANLDVVSEYFAAIVA